MSWNCIFAVLWQHPLIQSICPNVFNSFYRTVIHGESHGVFTSPSPSNGVHPHFTIERISSVAYPFFHIRLLEANSHSSLLGNDPRPQVSNSDLLSIGLLMNDKSSLSKTYLISNPCSETLLTFHFPKAIKHIFYLSSIPIS